MKLSHSRVAIPAAVALCFAVGMAGCSSTGQITPSPAVSNDIQTAYNAICAPAGLLAAAAPFATNAAVATYYNDAETLCANGVPTNEIVAGVDIFDLYLDLSTVLSKKSAMAKAHHLAVKHGRA
jgi:hypothetical protein